MSRVLAELLGADIPSFRLGLAELERLAGAPRADIRLAAEMNGRVRKQLEALGLDPANTTGLELFRILEQRLLHDEMTVRQALGMPDGVSSMELLQTVHRFLTSEAAAQKVFALKSTAARVILKKLKPKATMKALGYRSMDSMFKHESVLQLLVATDLIESKEWQAARREAYKKLQPKDFELRKVQYVLPSGKHWPQIARRYTEEHRHNMIVNTELAGVVILPLEVELPGLALLSIVLGLQAYEIIRARSALLKLHQVQPHFSEVLQEVVDHEPMTDVRLAGHSLPWRLVHWFYGSDHAPYYPDFFDPHLQADDFGSYDIYAPLEKLHAGLGFWRDGDMLALLDGQNGPVSFNLLDVALGVCNRIEYSARFVYNVRSMLWRELLGLYLGHEGLHAVLEDALGRQLNPEPVFDDIA